MTGREILKDIMNKQNKTNAQFADQLGITQATMWDRLNNKKVKDIPITMLDSMLRVLGYKICIVPRDFKVPSDGYKVD